MYRRRLLYVQFAVVLALTILHLTGLANDLYWRYLWLDTVSHALGGAWAALFFLWGFALLQRAPSIIWGIAAAITFGVAWELFELVSGPPPEANYAFDTSIDLLMDATGGVVGALFAKYFWNTSSGASNGVV